MKPLHLDCTSIADAWFQLIYNIFDNSYKQTIQKGSFEGEQHRLQYPGISIYIEHPDKDMVPVIPAGLGIPSPTTMEYIEDYFANYIMDPELAENETYKYASRINEEIQTDILTNAIAPNKLLQVPVRTQLSMVMDMLKKTPLTNQAVLEIATPQDLDRCIGNDGKLDPPCLRLIDFKPIPKACEDNSTCIDIPKDGKCPKHGLRCIMGYIPILTVSVYFRSWDLWAGFPTNLGGIELLKQYVASECGLVNGPMYAYSAGAHIYGYQEEIARIRTMKQTKEPEIVSASTVEFRSCEDAPE